jgi:hypothetical protein
MNPCFAKLWILLKRKTHMALPGAARLLINISLYLAVTLVSILTLFYASEAHHARLYYELRLYQQQKAATLSDMPVTPAHSLLTDPAFQGKTVRLQGELFTPKPLISKHFGEACSCYQSSIRERYKRMEYVRESSGYSKYGNTTREVQKEVVS